MVVGHITDPTDILGNTRFIDGNGDGRWRGTSGLTSSTRSSRLGSLCPATHARRLEVEHHRSTEQMGSPPDEAAT